jgi:hypothetical protein
VNEEVIQPVVETPVVLETTAPEPGSQRAKYITQLETDLQKASLSRQFVDSESGQFVITYISEVISIFTNKLLNTRRTNDEYIEIRAQIDILRKLKQVLEVKGSDKALTKIRADLDLAQSEE